MTETSSRYSYTFSVRFENNQKAYTFGSQTDSYHVQDAVVVETVRGLELGHVVSLARPYDPSNGRLDLQPILRKANARDLKSYEENQAKSVEAHKVCIELIKKLGLNMNLISSDYTLDHSKITFVYVADERVDFRDLLKELSYQLKTRIELKQIGARDKAKMVGGIGQCGMETCCSRHLQNFDVVSINMAKNQLLALNIQKLSGQCGKLMCCLKYEDDQYKALRQGCPKLNEQIDYNGKKMRVTGMNILSQHAKLENREETLFLPFVEAFREYRKKEALSHEATKELSE
jgi:cell fate regulator YaaT (PSP1 superfamily)